MKQINVNINGEDYSVNKGTTILKACEDLDIYVPRLCFLKGIHEKTTCRICVVEVEGELMESCVTKVKEGMSIQTNTDRVNQQVKMTLEAISSTHNFECGKCNRLRNCELLSTIKKTKNKIKQGLTKEERYEKRKVEVGGFSHSYEYDNSKCISCGRCIAMCHEATGLDILTFKQIDGKKVVAPRLGDGTQNNSGCIYCGKCIQSCPVAALKEKEDFEIVEDLLQDDSKFVIVMAAPAARVALGEEFGLPVGTNVEGKMYASFNELGFDEIADVNFGADITIIEEGQELLNRLESGKGLPMFTSCSPGWIRYIERFQHNYLDNLSSCKSPQQMIGATIKHYWAPKLDTKGKEVVLVSVMPCIAKKDEIKREEMEHNGIRDVDVVITTRELAKIIKRKRIKFNNLEDFAPTGDLAKYSGAGSIFGTTGGVMEAALRTVVDKLENKDMESIKYEMVRGVQDIKEATLEVAGKTINVVVVHGIKAIEQFFDILETGEKEFHFVEFMGCTGGCVNGGGQPIVDPHIYEKDDVRKLRGNALYSIDERKTLRKCHKSPSIIKVYEEFYKEPGSHLAHELLHTEYKMKDPYK